MNSARILLYVSLAGALAGVVYAQDSPKQKSAPVASEEMAEPSPDRVILKVGGVSITQAEFEANVGDIEPQADPDNADPDEKNRHQYGEDYASVLMLSQEAVENRLDTTPEIRRQLAMSRLQILSDAQFASLMRQAKPTPSEVGKYYSAHLADFEQVKLRRLFIWKVGPGSTNSKGMTPQAARARADAILKAAASGGDVEKLTAVFQGTDEGMLDPQPLTFTRGALSEKLEKQAFALKKGEWAEGEDTPDKIMLMHLVEHGTRSQAEVASLIEVRLQSQAMQAKLNELKKKSGIWMDESYFGSAVAKEPGEQRPVSDPPSTHKKSGQQEKRGEIE